MSERALSPTTKTVPIVAAICGGVVGVSSRHETAATPLPGSARSPPSIVRHRLGLSFAGATRRSSWPSSQVPFPDRVAERVAERFMALLTFPGVP
jgi:hypothetical protein